MRLTASIAIFVVEPPKKSGKKVGQMLKHIQSKQVNGAKKVVEPTKEVWEMESRSDCYILFYSVIGVVLDSLSFCLLSLHSVNYFEKFSQWRANSVESHTHSESCFVHSTRVYTCRQITKELNKIVMNARTMANGEKLWIEMTVGPVRDSQADSLNLLFDDRQSQKKNRAHTREPQR